MSRTNSIGPLTNLHHVSVAVRDLHRKWIDTYLSDVERDNGLTPRVYTRPASYAMVNLLTAVPGEDMSPSVIIITRGANRSVERQGNSFDVPLDVGIALVTTSYEGDGARDAAGAYAAATAGLLMHRKRLDGAVGGSCIVQSWDDIRLDDLPAEEQRTRAIVRLEFTVLVKDVLRTGVAGFTAPNPPADPTVEPGSRPTVLTHTTTLTKETA
jgi:hypothetical protein